MPSAKIRQSTLQEKDLDLAGLEAPDSRAGENHYCPASPTYFTDEEAEAWGAEVPGTTSWLLLLFFFFSF